MRQVSWLNTGDVMLKKIFEFKLEEELIYAHDGKADCKAKKLVLTAPSTQERLTAGKLSSYVATALQHMHNLQSLDKNKSQKKDEDEIDGATMFMFISGNLDDDKISNFLDLFFDLFTRGNICLIDGKARITQSILESIDLREFNRLAGEYIVNFLLPFRTNQ